MKLFVPLALLVLLLISLGWGIYYWIKMIQHDHAVAKAAAKEKEEWENYR
jgi:uncharacterized protein (UPF0333 family)